MKQVVILAGGKGTRLAERLRGLPKPLVDIGGVPLLERQILLVKRYGLTHVLVLVNHAAQYILDYCNAHENWGLELECIDDGEPRGTAGATLAVFDRLADEFLVMYGDTMLDVDLARFHATHATHPEAAATLLLHPNDHPLDSDLVELDDAGRVTVFHPYPHDTNRYYHNLVNAALYWVRRSGLEPFRERQGMLDFGKHVFPEMLARGQELNAYISPEYIKDIGTPARLDKVCNDLLSGRIERANLAHPQKAVFLDRDGTINREVGHLTRAEDFELLPGVAEAVRRLNHSDYRTIVVTNQPVLARGDCTQEELQRIHAKMETILGAQNAYLDRIYFCPHHPDGGFSGEVSELKVDCDCRKPKPGLVETACRELNIMQRDSWMVGDTLVDMAMAHAAGLRGLLVETGFAGMDYRAAGWPDYTVPDLPTAVDFILNGHGRLLTRAAELSGDIRAGDRVLVGGLSRSGKSNFSAALAESLRQRGLRTVVLALDRWLLDAKRRGAGVHNRYELTTLESLITELDSADKVVTLPLPSYNKLHRQRLAAAESVEIGPEHVLILEGTIALELRSACPTAHRFFVTLDERERRQRVIREYCLRGLSVVEAEAILADRDIDESPAVKSSATDAREVSL